MKGLFAEHFSKPPNAVYTMEITLNVSEDLAVRLRPLHAKLPQILELGLRELRAAKQGGFNGAAEVVETLAGLPNAEEVLALRPSKSLQKRMNALLEKNRARAWRLPKSKSGSTINIWSIWCVLPKPGPI